MQVHSHPGGLRDQLNLEHTNRFYKLVDSGTENRQPSWRCVITAGANGAGLTKIARSFDLLFTDQAGRR
jgi:hypothetical protein